MIWQKIWFPTTLVLVGVGTAVVTRTVFSQPAVPISYTVQIEQDLHRIPSGEFVRTERTTLLRRSDGSSVEIRHRQTPSGVPVDQRTVTDLSAKKTTAIDPFTESLTTYSLTDGQIAQRRELANQGCTGALPVAKILGFDVVRLERKLPGPPNQVRVEESWRAPSLGCLPLKETLRIGPNESELAIATVTRVTAVSQEEPGAAAFTIPAGYVERSPSQVLAEFGRRYNKQIPANSMQNSDRAYFSHQR